MNGLKSGLIGLLGAGLLSACAETPQKTEVPAQASNEPVAATPAPESAKTQALAAAGDGEAKLVIYRTSYGGFALQPKVFVDGKEAAKCTPGRVTTIKVAPGTHRVTAQTLKEKAVAVSVPEGGTAYVKCSISVGLLVGGAKLVVVPEAEAAAKVARLKAR